MFEDFSDEFQDLSEGEIEEKDKECIKILSGEDILSENAEEDNQIGDKEDKGPVTLEMDRAGG